MKPLQLYKCLADQTRLISLLLIHKENELCVCELSAALDEQQPKVSRNLAQLKKCELLIDRRQGQWVFYQLNPTLPQWVIQVITQTQQGNSELLSAPLNRLYQMGNRPQRLQRCCG